MASPTSRSITALTVALTLCTGLSLVATPAEAYRPNPSQFFIPAHDPQGSAQVQPGQQFPWFDAVNTNLYNDRPTNNLDETTMRRVQEWHRAHREELKDKGSLYGATYTFNAVSDTDTPTKEIAPRFFTWDPTGKDGSTRAAHIMMDASAFQQAHMELGHPEAFAGVAAKRRYYMVNEQAWADGIAALSIFDQAEIGEGLLINPTHTLTPFNRTLLTPVNGVDEFGVDVTFVGGPQVLSEGLKAEINSLKTEVNRVAGASRIETMIAAARTANQYRKEAYTYGGFIPQRGFEDIRVTRAYAPEGANVSTAYADVIGTRGTNTTTVLTTSEALHPATASYLKKETLFGGCEYEIDVTLVGGPAALSPRVREDIVDMVCAEPGNAIIRVEGANRFETNLLDILYPWKLHNPPEETVFPRLPGIMIVDGESADMWQVAIPLRMAFPYFSLVYVGTDRIPEKTASYLRAFGHSYRLTDFPLYAISPPEVAPGYTTRTVLCYASQSVCSQVQSLMNDQMPIDAMPLISDDPVRPLGS